MSSARVALGKVVATPGALDALQEAGQGALEFIRRHVIGDWGALSEEDKQENELSVREGFRILSSDTLKSGVKIWLIAAAERSVTTILSAGKTPTVRSGMKSFQNPPGSVWSGDEISQAASLCVLLSISPGVGE